MANDFEIRVTAIDQVTAEVRKMKASLAGMTKPVTDLGKSMRALGKELGFQRITADLGKLRNAANDAARGVASLVPPIAALTGVGTLAGIGALVSSFGKMSVSTQNTASIIGISAQNLTKWEYAARRAGVSADAMVGSLKGIGVAGEAALTDDARMMGVFRSLELSVSRKDDGSFDTEKTMLDLADLLKAHTNAQYRQRAVAALGLSDDVIPFLAQGRQAVQAQLKAASKYVPSASHLAEGRKFNEFLADLDFSADKLRNSLGVALAPAIEKVIGGAQRLIDKYGDIVASKVAEYAERLANWLDKTDWAKVADDVSKFVDSIGGVKTIGIAIAAITFAGPIASVASLIATLGTLTLVTIPAALSALRLLSGGSAAARAAATAAPGAAATAGGGLSWFGAAGLAGILSYFTLNALDKTGALPFASEDAGRSAILNGHPFSSSVSFGNLAVYGRKKLMGEDPALDERKAYLIEKLRAQGYSNEQIAGQMGSLLQENSTLDPHIDNGQGAAGIAQWNGSRRAAFKKKYGADVTDAKFEQQVDFYLAELKGAESAADNRIRSAKTVAEATEAHARYFERPAESEMRMDRRLRYANDVYASLANAAQGKLDESGIKIFEQGPNGKLRDVSGDNGGLAKLDESQFRILQQDANGSTRDVTNGPARVDLKVSFDGLPAGARPRVTSSAPNVSVETRVARTSLGQDSF